MAEWHSGGSVFPSKISWSSSRSRFLAVSESCLNPFETTLDSPGALSFARVLITDCISSRVKGRSNSSRVSRLGILDSSAWMSIGIGFPLKILSKCGVKASAFCLSHVANSPSVSFIFIVEAGSWWKFTN